jgi:hypothetical protein
VSDRTSIPTPSVDADNPWRFLTALDGDSELDRRLIRRTRRDEIQIVSHMVAASRVSVLYAFSGNGKTSLINAGLIPFLTDNRYAVFKMRPRPPWSIESPTQAFKDSLLRDICLPLFRQSDLEILSKARDRLADASEIEKKQLESLIMRVRTQAERSEAHSESTEAFRAYLKQYVDEPLVEYIRRIQSRLDPDTKLAFICDQFEELFVHYGNTPEMDEFVEQLGEMWADDSLRVRIVFSMREDWVGSMIAFRRAIPDIFSNYFKLEPITRSRAGDVLVMPLESVGVSIDGGTVETVLDDLADAYEQTQKKRFSDVNLTPSRKGDPFIELPALQVVADRLWATREAAPGPFSPPHYRSLLESHIQDEGDPGPSSPAQTVLDDYLGDLLDSIEDADELTGQQWRELRTDCLYLLTDKTRHRRALPESLLLDELKSIRSSALALPTADRELVRKAIEPLESVRLVREEITREGEKQYELAHDFAVRSARCWIARRSRESGSSRCWRRRTSD